jgi:hypothetical protein
MSELKSRVLDVLEPLGQRLERVENLELLSIKKLTSIETLLKEVLAVTRATHDGLEELRSHVGDQVNRIGDQARRNTNAIMGHEGRIKTLETEGHSNGNGNADAE